MLAFTFPGQGSQKPGMGEAWREHESWELVEEASDHAGRDVAELLLHADAETLRDTRNAQLTTYVTSLIVLDAVERLGIEHDVCAGHSLGEYTALSASGSMEFGEGVRLVSERAAAMHEAGSARIGTMAAVLGLEDDQVEIACRLAQSEVWVANINAPGQIVIAGSPEGVAAAGEQAKILGAKKVMPLAVAGAFHTPFMEPARDRLRAALSATDLRDTEISVIANVDSQPHREGSKWDTLLSAQLTSPVRWKQSLLTMAEMGITRFAELGPGGVLTGMAKRTVPGARTISVATPEDLNKLLEWIAETPAAALPAVEGEFLFAVERLVVSPAAGIFTPIGLEDGVHIEVGTLIGHVGDAEVRSPFAGVLQSYIAVPTERVTPRQPIAWLRSN
jgi:[acyl-carrier-protein] S-malonyltransferase